MRNNIGGLDNEISFFLFFVFFFFVWGGGGAGRVVLVTSPSILRNWAREASATSAEVRIQSPP